MRRTTFIALAVFAASAVWSASASAYTYSSSHRYFQQNSADAGGLSINLTVDYAKRSPKGKSTPRNVYVAFQAPVSCQVGGSATATVQSGPFKLKDKKAAFSGSFAYQAPSGYPDPGSSGSYYVSGKLIKKKNWRMNGTVTVLTYGFSPTFLNCSGGEVSYSAKQCWWWPPSKTPMCTEPVSGQRTG